MPEWTIDNDRVLPLDLGLGRSFSAASIRTLESLMSALPVDRGYILRAPGSSGGELDVVAGQSASGESLGVDRHPAPDLDFDDSSDEPSIHRSADGEPGILCLRVPLSDGEAFLYVLELRPGHEALSTLPLDDFARNFRIVAAQLRSLFTIEKQSVRLEELDRRLMQVGRDEAPTEDQPDESPVATGQVTYYQGLITRSPKMLELINTIERIKDNDLNIVVCGETGTGKELIARAIHNAGVRRDRPFESVGCGTLTASLLESELFGHKRGAFSGAEKDHKGIFERANRGTVFFDEVGDMSPEMQQKVLRVLQEGEVRPVGSADVIPVDVRIISSSRIDLQELVKAGKFRDDLFYRLNVFSVDLPPLRERPEDIPVLIDHFLSELCEDNDEKKTIADGAMRELRHYGWPGNAQELRNVLTRAYLSSTTRSITRKLVQPLLSNELMGVSGDSDLYQDGDRLHLRIPLQQGFNEIIAECELLVLLNALRCNRGNKSRVTKQLGIPRQTLYNKIEKYGIRDEDYQSRD